jgi:hypothetical protein
MVPPFFDFLQAFTIQDVADIFQLAHSLSHLALLDASSPFGRGVAVGDGEGEDAALKPFFPYFSYFLL